MNEWIYVRVTVLCFYLIKELHKLYHIHCHHQSSPFTVITTVIVITIHCHQHCQSLSSLVINSHCHHHCHHKSHCHQQSSPFTVITIVLTAVIVINIVIAQSSPQSSPQSLYQLTDSPEVNKPGVTWLILVGALEVNVRYLVPLVLRELKEGHQIMGRPWTLTYIETINTEERMKNYKLATMSPPPPPPPHWWKLY